MDNKQAILATIQNRPGIGVAELAGALGMHKPNARRDALQLVAKGLATAQEDELGYRFFPAGAAPVHENAVASTGPAAHRQRESAYAGRSGSEARGALEDNSHEPLPPRWEHGTPWPDEWPPGLRPPDHR